jgi:protein TonB
VKKAVPAKSINHSPQGSATASVRLPLVISLAVHAFVILGLGFAYPEIPKAMRDKAMDIILVNAKSSGKPHDAQALAQANLDGGGNTDEHRRAKTPLPPTAQEVAGSDIEQMQRRVQELEARQQQLLTHTKSLHKAAASPNALDQPAPTPSLSGLDLLESSRAMARLEGEIDRNVDDYNKRPRKKNIGARTTEYRFAQYIEDWRHKIERIGTMNYPEAARGKLYGSLTLTVSIKADGSVTNIEINRSSGYKVLDDAARRIVQMASPYAPFPPDIRRDTDVLEITRVWSFTQGDQLATSTK